MVSVRTGVCSRIDVRYIRTPQSTIRKMTDAELQLRIRRCESFLVAADGQFLGILSSNKYLTESIMNEYGSYGSKYSSTSIFNQYSRYGNQYDQLSPFNQYSQTPPRIFLRGNIVGYLSANRNLPNYLDPHKIFDFIYNNGL